jgi:hypothetical protein
LSISGRTSAACGQSRRASNIGIADLTPNDAALAPADDDRLVRERGVVALLDRGIEGVAIDVGDRERLDLRMAQDARRAAAGAPSGPVRRVTAAVAAETGHDPPARLLVWRI